MKIMDSDAINAVQGRAETMEMTHRTVTQEEGRTSMAKDPVLKQYPDVFDGLGCLEG